MKHAIDILEEVGLFNGNPTHSPIGLINFYYIGRSQYQISEDQCKTGCTFYSSKHPFFLGQYSKSVLNGLRGPIGGAMICIF
jgi:hypothetical protein